MCQGKKNAALRRINRVKKECLVITMTCETLLNKMECVTYDATVNKLTAVKTWVFTLVSRVLTNHFKNNNLDGRLDVIAFHFFINRDT